MRGNEGKNHRYTVEDKVAVLKLLDEGLSQKDVEMAKGIPTRTIRRWIKSKKVLQAKMAVKNEDIPDMFTIKDKPNMSTIKDKPDMNSDKPDSNMSEKDAKTDISDSTDKVDISIEDAYNDGLTAGRNQGMEEAADTSEKAAKEYIKEQDEKIKGLVEEIKRKIAESKSRPIEEAPETPEPIEALPEPEETKGFLGLSNEDLILIAGAGVVGGWWMFGKKKGDKDNDTGW